MIGIGAHSTVRKFVEMFVDEVVGPLEAKIYEWCSAHDFGIGGL
jgi:hypothetical protein